MSSLIPSAARFTTGEAYDEHPLFFGFSGKDIVSYSPEDCPNMGDLSQKVNVFSCRAGEETAEDPGCDTILSACTLCGLQLSTYGPKPRATGIVSRSQ